MIRVSELSTLLRVRFGSVDAVVADRQRKHAAVALILRPGGPGPAAPLIQDSEMLIIKRAQSERDPWSGHMAFPGGRVDPADASLVHTAVRETMEETDVGLSEGPAIGRLDAVHPAGPGLPQITIWPFVFQVPRGTQGTPEPREVDALHWFSVTELQDEANHGRYRLKHRGKEREFPCVRVGGHVVWGLTYRILTQFLDVAVGRP